MSISMNNFDHNAFMRGAQLTIVGALRALQNPALFTSEHYRQAAIAVCAGIAIRLIVALPTLGIRGILWFLSFFIDLQHATWDDDVVDLLEFIEHSVLQLPIFLMTFMKHISPALDNMFMESLRWVDYTYVQKHKSEDPATLRAMYYPNMSQYPTHGARDPKTPEHAGMLTVRRYGRKALISLAIFALSHVPHVGRFVLPAASFYTFNKAVGLQPALLVFGSSLFFPRRYLVVFLQSYFSSRTLMRDLLEPYFIRIRYTPEQKRTWFHDREGILFGFGVGFFIFLKIPLLGVLIYGLAEASTAYLITKITDPPPPPAAWREYADKQAHWQNKHEFLKLPLDKLDKLNVLSETQSPREPQVPSKKFT